MIQRKFRIKLLTYLLILFLVGCQSTLQTTQPPPTEIPLTDTPVLPSATQISTSTPIPTGTPVPTSTSKATNTLKPTSTRMPTNTPTLSGPTLTALPERPVGSMNELIGFWEGFWQDDVWQEFNTNAEGKVYWAKYAEWFETESYTFKDGILTWGEITATVGESDECLKNPSASYKVYITYRDDQRDSLRFELVSPEQCHDRQTFLDGKILTWVGEVMP